MGCTGYNTNFLNLDNNLGISRYYLVYKSFEMQKKVVPSICGQ